jgi:predicted transcriptional regulator
LAKPKLRKQARELRQEGLGVKTIAYRLGVSSSTVSLWCKDIKLSPEQIKELERRAHDPFYGRRLQNVIRQKTERSKKIEEMKEEGIRGVGRLTPRDLFIAGIALYWAEGFKKDSRLGFANSDPKMIKFFLKWLIKSCKVPKEAIRFRVGLNISHKNRIQEVEKYWSSLTRIPLSQFQKSFFQKFVWKKEFPKPEKYFGVLRIRANKQLTLFRRIHGWIEGLKLNAS